MSTAGRSTLCPCRSGPLPNWGCDFSSELRRTPSRRSSQNCPSTHSGEKATMAAPTQPPTMGCSRSGEKGDRGRRVRGWPRRRTSALSNVPFLGVAYTMHHSRRGATRWMISKRPQRLSVRRSKVRGPTRVPGGHVGGPAGRPEGHPGRRPRLLERRPKEERLERRLIAPTKLFRAHGLPALGRSERTAPFLPATPSTSPY